MSVILSIQTFNKLEEKLGTDSAKQVYELAEAIFEEIQNKTEQKLEKYKIDFADEDYKRLTRREINEFKEELFKRQEQNRAEFALEVKNHLKKVTSNIKILIAVSSVNLIALLVIIYRLLIV